MTSPKTGWPVFLALVPVVLGTVWLTALTWPQLQSFSLATRYLILVGLVAMATESLFRSFLMNGWVTTAWRYSFVESLPALLAVVFYVGGAVLVVIFCRGWRVRLVAGVGVAALLVFVVRPALYATIDALLQRLEYLNHKARYGFPLWLAGARARVPDVCGAHCHRPRSSVAYLAAAPGYPPPAAVRICGPTDAQ